MLKRLREWIMGDEITISDHLMSVVGMSPELAKAIEVETQKEAIQLAREQAQKGNGGEQNFVWHAQGYRPHTPQETFQAFAAGADAADRVEQKRRREEAERLVDERYGQLQQLIAQGRQPRTHQEVIAAAAMADDWKAAMVESQLRRLGDVA